MILIKETALYLSKKFNYINISNLLIKNYKKDNIGISIELIKSNR